MDGEREREAFELAVAALGRKERSTAELRQLLAARGVAEVHAEAALRRLTEIGELDDRRFALAYAADKRELRGWGPDRIRAALVERGIAPQLAQEAAAEGHGEQAERAVSLLRERGQLLDADRERARALAYLARRGFDYEVAYEAVRRAVA